MHIFMRSDAELIWNDDDYHHDEKITIVKVSVLLSFSS